MQNNDNKRRHLRLVHRAKVRLSNTDEFIIGYTKDISDSGVFVYGVFQKSPMIGDKMEVQLLDIDDAIARPVIVRRIDPAGIAVEFV